VRQRHERQRDDEDGCHSHARVVPSARAGKHRQRSIGDDRGAMEKREQLTAAQRAALERELAELEGPKRTEIVQAIKTAREFGDLSENFEYHAAKNEQGMLEARIRTLRSRLNHSVVVESQAGAIAVGSHVVLEDAHGERMEVEISSVGGSGAVS